MKFYERVISDFGGYEKCKDILNQPNIDFIMNAQGLREHMLEYRRQHNIFEVGDKVVVKNDCLIEFADLTLNLKVLTVLMATDEGFVRAVESAGLFKSSLIKHATDAEIKAGKRLEVNQ